MPADTVEVVVKLTGLAAVQAGMRRLRDSISGPLESAAQRARGFALSLGTSLLAGFSGYRVAAELKRALDGMDRAAATSQRLGVVTDELTGLEYAATLAESSAEDLHTSLKFLAKAAAANADAFTTLGIEVRTADGRFRPHSELIAEIAERFQSMPDGVQKTALALELFGRQGLSMIPLLNSGAEGIRAMVAEARTFGLVVAPEAAAGANALNDNLERLKLAVQGLARTALAELLPVLLDLSNRLVQWVKDTDAVRRGAELLAEVLRHLLFQIQALIIVGQALWRSWMANLEAVGTQFEVLGRLIARTWQHPLELIRAVIEYVKTAVRAAGDLAEALLFVTQGRFAEAKDKAKAAAAEIAEAMATAAQSALHTLAESGDAVRDVFKAPFEAAAATAGTFIDETRKAFAELQRAFLAVWMPPALPAVPARAGAVDLDLDPADDRRKRLTRELRDAQYELQGQRQLVASQMARLEADFATREADKHRQRIALLREEIRLIDAEIERLRERLALERDEQVRDQLTQSLRGFENERRGVQTQLGRFEQAPDPYSMRDQMLSTITDLENQIGTTAQSVARQFAQVIGSAIDGVQQGIEGLIKGTLDWGDALRHIGSSIVNGVISAISRMFAEWIVKRALMAAKNIFFSQAEGQADAAAKAPGALMSSISSFGVAALVGTAALIAAIAAISGGFAEGGVVRGPGGPKDDAILARLSNGEGILNAAAVRHYGEGIVTAMNRRTVRFYAAPETDSVRPRTPPGSTVAGTGAPPTRSAAVSLVLVDDRKEARQYIESSEGEAHIVRVVRKHRLDLGIGG